MTGFLVVVAFPFMWVAICYLLGWWGGWMRLAERFRAPGKFEGRTSPFCSANMGSGFQPVNYGSCLILGASEEGLYLDILPFFRPGHPPLLVPWREVRVGERKKMFFMFGEMVTLHLGRSEDVQLQLYGATADKLLAARGTAA